MRIVTTLIVVFLSSGVSPAKAETIGISDLLRQNYSLSLMSQAKNWTVHLDSSYDRTGGNADTNKYLRKEGDEFVCSDLQGPGAIVRIWFAANKNNSRIRIYIDDNPTPAVDMPYDDMWSGKTEPFIPPITNNSMEGYWSYLPIPYAKHCKVTVSPSVGYYHVESIRFPDNTEVRPFTMPLADIDNHELHIASDAWTPPYPVTPFNLTSVTIKPGQTATYPNVKGSATIHQLVVNAASASDVELRKLVLRITFDNHKTPDVESPLSDFFGNAYGHKEFEALPFSQKSSGDMIFRLPMPFEKSARITIENGNAREIPVGVAVDSTPGRFRHSQDLYLHADFHEYYTQKGKPHTWMSTTGQKGKLVGIVQAMESPYGYWFLEGDDQIRIDNETFKSCQVQSTVIGPWNGTGTEDFFNSGWYFGGVRGAFPMHGCLRKANNGEIDAFRFFGLDAPVFQKSIDAQIEHGGTNDAANNTYYSSLAFWYGDAERTPIAPMPAASSINLPYAHQNRFKLKGPGVIEGADLAWGPHKKPSAGSVDKQLMADFKGDWSNGYQLKWRGAKENDTLLLKLDTVAKIAPGNYELVAYLTKGDDYGTFSFAMNGQPLGSTFDAYSTEISPTGPISFGQVTIPDGEQNLVVTITGKNAASKAMTFGLNTIVLKKIP